MRWALAVVIVVAAAWLAGIRGPYHFDDAITPVSDPASASLAAWSTHLTDTLRPLTKLTYAIEGSLGLDDEPAARRAVSIAIFAVGAGLLCLLLSALVPRLSPAGAAALAAAWGLHPVHAEAVLAIAGRTAALSGTLVIAALLAHTRNRPRLAAVLYGLSALARETAIATLVALVAVELATERRPWREHVRRLIPSVMAFVVAAVWLVATERVRELADYSFHGRPFGASALHQLAAVPVGLSLYVRTWALSIDHGTPLPTGLAIVGIGLFVARSWRSTVAT